MTAVPIGPDPERDARVAARRAADARKAGVALDHLLRHPSSGYGTEFVKLLGDYVVSRLHHNCHYDVPGPASACDCPPPYGRSMSPNPFCPVHGAGPGPGVAS